MNTPEHMPTTTTVTRDPVAKNPDSVPSQILTQANVRSICADIIEQETSNVA